MKIAVVCANGRVGKLVVKEAVDRGLDVTAIAKGENQTAAKEYVRRDLFDLTAADMAPYDVVVDAFGAWAEEELPNHTKSLMHLCDILSGTEKRLLVVGGAGSLYVDAAHTTVVSDGPDFPAETMKVPEFPSDLFADFDILRYFARIALCAVFCLRHIRYSLSCFAGSGQPHSPLCA